VKLLFKFDCTKLKEPPQPVHDAILWCIERRIQGLRGAFAAQMGIEQQHIPLIRAGGIKAIVTPRFERDAEALMEEIQFVHEKFELQRLYAMAHFNCAACEGSQDQSYYEFILAEGTEKLRKRFPQIEIIPVYVDCEGVHDPEAAELESKSELTTV
jgi:hypothetical protein